MHSLDDVRETVKKAEECVRVGCFYRHYRDKDKIYKVLAIAINEKDNGPCVVYQALYGDGLIWVRAVSVWCEEVEYNGKIVSRFIYSKDK